VVRTFAPRDWQEALFIRKHNDVLPLVGGTDLMVRYKSDKSVVPKFSKAILLLSQIREIKNIFIKDGMLHIGAGCTLTDIVNFKDTPIDLKDAIINMAGPGIRNVATMAGNIANASPAGDTLPVLYARDAKCIIESVDGNREVAIANLITSPGRTSLKNDELIKEIVIPATSFNFYRYKKVGTRKALALSKLSFVGLANVKNDIITDIRIAFGAVAPTVVRRLELEAGIISKNIADLSVISDKIVEGYSNFIRPINDQRSSMEYRKEVSLRLFEDFLRSLQK